VKGGKAATALTLDAVRSEVSKKVATFAASIVPEARKAAEVLAVLSLKGPE
jgi:uncharacterized membrane protein